MAKKKVADHVTMQVHLPLVLAGQVRQIAYWAQTEPETVIRVFLAAALLQGQESFQGKSGEPGK